MFSASDSHAGDCLCPDDFHYWLESQSLPHHIFWSVASWLLRWLIKTGFPQNVPLINPAMKQSNALTICCVCHPVLHFRQKPQTESYRRCVPQNECGAQTCPCYATCSIAALQSIYNAILYFRLKGVTIRFRPIRLELDWWWWICFVLEICIQKGEYVGPCFCHVCLFFALSLLLLVFALCFVSILRLEFIKRSKVFTPYLEIYFSTPTCACFWLRSLISHLFMVKPEFFFRRHWCNDSCLASWPLVSKHD